jgi:hypothetical protein
VANDVATRQQQQASVAFQVEASIKRTAKFMRTAWAKLAEDLYRFHDLEMWRDLGHKSFEEWVADPEVGFEYRWVIELIALWRELVVTNGADPKEFDYLQPSKLQAVLPAVRRGYVKVDEALADVRALSRDDLRERYTPQGTDRGRPDTSTRYEATAEPAYCVCPTCGSRVKEEQLRGH